MKETFKPLELEKVAIYLNWLRANRSKLRAQFIESRSREFFGAYCRNIFNRKS